MYGQRALAHSIQVQQFVQRAFPPADFFFSKVYCHVKTGKVEVNCD